MSPAIASGKSLLLAHHWLVGELLVRLHKFKLQDQWLLTNQFASLVCRLHEAVPCLTVGTHLMVLHVPSLWCNRWCIVFAEICHYCSLLACDQELTVVPAVGTPATPFSAD